MCCACTSSAPLQPLHWNPLALLWEFPCSEKSLVLKEGRKMSFSPVTLIPTHSEGWIGISGFSVAAADLAHPSKILVFLSTWSGHPGFHKQEQLRGAGGRECQQHSHFCIYYFCKSEVQIVCRISITPLIILSCAISSLWKQGFQRVRKSFELVIYNGFEYSDKVTGQSRGDSCGQ